MCRPSALACDACDAPTPDFARLVRSFPKVWPRRGTVLKHIRHPLGLCRAELILQDEDLRRRNRLVRAALLLAGGVAMAGCGRKTELTLFELLPPSTTGVTFMNAVPEQDTALNIINFLTYYNGGGVAVGDIAGYSSQAVFCDYEADGDLDMYLLNHSAHSERGRSTHPQREPGHPRAGDRLLRSDGGHFVDVSDQADIYGGVEGYGLGVFASE